MLIEKLPLELIYQVFSFVDSAQDLAQCRLVCKRLNRPAERAMFMLPITVKSVSAATALLYHLMSNNDMGKLITSLDLKTVPKEQVHVYLNLLPLVFTPSLEIFRGDIRAPIFYKHLVRIARASNTRYSNLKVIPLELFRGSKEYYKAIFFFKETLQEVSISWHDPPRTPWHAFNRLGELTQLTHLTLDGEISSVLMLDRMLTHCNHLKALNVMLLGVMPTVEREYGFFDWMEAHVQKVPSVTKLVIEKARQPDVIEYLMYKYPNVKEAVLLLTEPEYYAELLDLTEEGPVWLMEYADTQPLIRVLRALEYLPFYRIGYMDHITDSVMEAIETTLEDSVQDEVIWGDGPSPGWRDIRVYNDDDYS